MLDGLANIILRPNMTGLMSEYQKMKKDKYEIPISSFDGMLDDTLYSRRGKTDNGEQAERVRLMLEKLAEPFDKIYPGQAEQQRKPAAQPTKSQKLQAARDVYDIQRFDHCQVDTENNFVFQGQRYHIDESVTQYAPKVTKDGELLYDMDRIICGTAEDGTTVFFDMNIDLVREVEKIFS